VRIVDLAHRIIRMAGLMPGRDIEVRFTGQRPGERLHEVLSVVPLIPSVHPRISIADQGFPGPITLMGTMRRFVRLAAAGDREALRRELLETARHHWQFDPTPRQGLAPDFVVDLTESAALAESAEPLETAS
ncbi:MAG: polysaccharide biosynthesis protein, partial [Actinobacteria bacterium]|nr:polysaccharide biosynthesis protein [Actinomycetota bacterium]